MINFGTSLVINWGTTTVEALPQENLPFVVVGEALGLPAFQNS